MNIYYLSRVMRIIMLLLLTGFLTVNASSYSQQITLKGRNIPFSAVIDAIRKQSGYTVFGTKKLLDAARPVTIDVKDMPLSGFMDKIIEDQPISYVIEDKIISLSEKAGTRPGPVVRSTESQQLSVSGVVRHAETKELLQAVSVQLKGATTGTKTNEKGEYRLVLPASDEKQVIVFTYIGMKKLEIPYQKQEKLNVELQPDEVSMGEVVVTGIYQRERESFTGSSARFSAKDLKAVGNQNVFQSLRTLDPSFAIIDNNTFGSNPNRLPDIEIRGKSSVIGLTDQYSSNPNQPLFILDGFESSLATIRDLSMDRIESITLLKDASATAIYGSKAANGVVVVETKRPQPGELRINYTLNSTVSFADLSDYNLMNAEEKLRFEYLSGHYGKIDDQGGFVVNSGNEASQILYYDRLKEVKRGVNTYWANEPLRTALTQGHTLLAEGGDAALRYGVTLSIGNTGGVMKGSDRKTMSGNVRLMYRKGRIAVNNSLTIDYTKANNEPVPFSQYSRANPYYRKYDESGNVNKLLESYIYSDDNLVPRRVNIYSPLYDESNLNIDWDKSQGFTNNFEAEWRITEPLRLRGRLGIRSFTTRSEQFRSPFDTEFEGTDPLKKGKYDEENGKNLNYDGDLTLTFGKLFSGKHMVNAVAGMKADQAVTQNGAYEVQGFIDDEFSNPNFALGYPEGERADYQESKRRGVGFFMNTGYSYDQRYLVDATIRSDGSSIYGSNGRFSTIWSFGLSWNVHREAFFKNGASDWLNQFRLRASIGNPGNQNFNDYISMKVYRYNNENRNPFGASTIISNMGNNELKWQTTLDRNFGADLVLFDERLSVTGDYYIKDTDPLLVFISLPSSVGTTSAPQNMGGQVTHGINLSSDYALLRSNTLKWRVNFSLRHLRSEYRDIGNKLSSFNEANRSRNLVRYYDGGRPSDLWAVRSVGIDPATGREIFLNSDNEQTFVHNYKDEVVVGNSDPDIEGVIGTSVVYKGFSASVNLRYRLGGQAFMQTLYDKVENITAANITLNQDRRALYDRWQKPGDVARFKAISNKDYTPISSRFVADNNILSGESFSIRYENTTAAWLKSMRMSSFSFSAYMNDIFYISTIKNERGIDYPFARSVSFSAAVRF